MSVQPGNPQETTAEMVQHSPTHAPALAADKSHDRQGIGDLLAVGFGTTSAMWAVGYVGHMPLTQVHPSIFVSLMLACIVAGGVVIGRYARRGLAGGLWVGLIVATLNLLIVGSIMTNKSAEGVSATQLAAEAPITPQAMYWIPGTYLLSIVLALIGCLVGRAFHKPADLNWKAAFVWITVATTLLLILAGGLVTGFRAGLAVPDWPNSFGVNMFLLPLRKMTGGTFYEHAHRLLGSLVGFTAFTLAVYLTLIERRRGIRILVWLVGIGIGLQGLLGGLRVTGELTWSVTGLDPANELAVVHGLFAHVVLAGLVAVAVMASRRWTTPAVEERWGASTDRFLSVALVLIIVIQTFLGTLVRHYDRMLLFHITVAVVASLVALGVGMRAWGLNERQPTLRRAGIALMLILLLQITLGIIAVPFRTPPVDASPDAHTLLAADDLHAVTNTTPAQALITTLHQTNAAILLLAATVVALWSYRLLREAPEPPMIDDAPETPAGPVTA